MKNLLPCLVLFTFSILTVSLHAQKAAPRLTADGWDTAGIRTGRFYLGAILQPGASKEVIIASSTFQFRTDNGSRILPSRVCFATLIITSDAIPDAEKKLLIEGSRLSPEAIAIIRKLRKNDVIEFTEISAILYNGCPKPQSSFSLRIE